MCFVKAAPIHIRPTSASPFYHPVQCKARDSNRKTKPSSRKVAKRAKPKHVKALPANLRPEQLPPPPPAHRSIPVVGFFVEKALGLSQDKFDKYGPIWTSNYLVEDFAYVGDYEAVVEILRDSKLFQSEGASDEFASIFGVDNLVALDPPQHTRARNVVASAFAPNVFPFYFDRLVTKLRSMWESVLHECESKRSVKMDPAFRRHYLTIIVELTTGIDMDSDSFGEVRDMFHRLQDSLSSPAFGPVWNDGQKAKSQLADVLKDAVQAKCRNHADTIAALRKYGERFPYQSREHLGRGELDVMLIAIAFSELKSGAAANENKFVESLCNLMLLLWFAGYGTSAATASCALFEMGWDPSIVAQLTEEQEALVATDGQRNVTYDQVSEKMPLLDSYINEIMRLRPASGSVSRKASKDVEILGRYVKQGTSILVSLGTAMRDPRFFPNPNTLIPDRFVPKEGTPPANEVLSLGASGSPHYCVGGSLAKILMKTTFAVLLRDYSFVLNPKQSRKYKTLPEQVPKSEVEISTFSQRNVT